MKTKVLMVLAGAAMASTAFAQSSLDRDRAYAAELNADAAARGSQLAASDEGAFKLTAGNNTLYIGGYTQFRYTQDFRSDNVGDSDDFTHGFSLPNTKLTFWGNVYEPNLKYKIQGNWSDETSSGFNLEDAYAWYTWDSGMWVKWGQFKSPLFREEMIDNNHQLAVARSMTNDAFAQRWSQGIEVGYQAEQFRIMGDVSDGWRSANTDFNSGSEADIALTARVEFQAMGTDWDRWNDFTSWRGADNGLLIGAAIHWETGGETGDGVNNVDPTNFDYLLYTIDAAFEGNGWNVYGAFLGSNYDPDGASSSDSFGFLLQGGVFITDKCELFARWDWTMADEDLTSPKVDPNDIHFLTLGFNCYITPNSHAAKVTGNLIWAFNKTAQVPPVIPSGLSSPYTPNTSAQVLGDSDDGEISWALQFTLGF